MRRHSYDEKNICNEIRSWLKLIGLGFFFFEREIPEAVVVFCCPYDGVAVSNGSIFGFATKALLNIS